MKYNINDYNNKIIKIVSQNIEINYEEPYKLEKATKSIGTGFFIKNNYIITCSHCVENAKDIYIEIANEGQRKYKVKLIGLCPEFDIALLKSVEYKNKEYFQLGNSDKEFTGIEVVAIGFPLGQNNIKITRGIVSGRQNGLIQTDTPVNPGNSGGPLLYNKKVIGIVKSGILKSNNIGYAVPINKFNTIKKELYDKKNILITRSTLYDFLLYNNTNKNLLDLYNAKSGIYINTILNQDIPLKKQDILLSINKNKIDNFGYIQSKKLNQKIEITELFDYIKIGDKIEIEYVRNKKQCKNSFIYSNKELSIKRYYTRFNKIDYEIIDGLVLTDLSNNYLYSLHKEEELNESLYKYLYIRNKTASKIVLSYIYPNTNIANLDILEKGDIITKVNNIEVSTIEELRKAALKYTLHKKKKYILLETAFDERVIIDIEEYKNKNKNMRNTFIYPETLLHKKICNI